MFSDLTENCSKIAADAGLHLEPDAAFQWLGNGRFARDSTPVVARAAQWNLGHVKHLIERFSEQSVSWAISKSNVFRLNLEGAEKDYTGQYESGQVVPIRTYKRVTPSYPFTVTTNCSSRCFRATATFREICDTLWKVCEKRHFGGNPYVAFAGAIEVLEAMIPDGWVNADRNEAKPFLQMEFQGEGYLIQFVESV